MATYSFTSSSVLPIGATQGAVAGEALVAGEFVYLNPADGKARKAMTGGALDLTRVAGMAVNSAVAGQPVSLSATGEVTVNSAFSLAGQLLVLSGTAGRCMDATDLEIGQHLTVIGWSTAANKLRLNLAASGVKLE
ncbi:MAG: hypothetical protein IPM64_10695 [Phycisphaerales bacterium]|nr:hypothetical protein [Phycisphaerales bacterium]